MSSNITIEKEHIIIPYTPLPYQREIHNDPHRFKVLVTGRRAGKTTLAVNQLIYCAIQRNLPVPYWYLAPYNYQVKEIAWHMLLKYLPKKLWRKKPTESDLTVYLINGATISLKGCDNAWGLEGTALGGLIIDEVSAIVHFQSLWEYTLRPMLADYEAPALMISKPRGFNFFHTIAKIGDHENHIEGELPEGLSLNADFNTYRLPTEINCREHHGGYLTHEEIEHARTHMSPEAYDQEFNGLFVRYSGLVHKLFSRDIHIIPDFSVPHEWRRIRGYDFGSTNPTASIRIAIDSDDNWFIESCYKVQDKSIDDHTAYIQQEDSDMEFPIPGYGDPSGKQWITEFNQKGLDIQPARRQENTSEKNWLQLGIDMINGKLEPKEGHIVYLPDGTKKEHTPSLFILNRPQNFQLVEELESLAYKEQNGINIATIDETRDKHGHYDLHATLRYAIVSMGYQVSFHAINVKSHPSSTAQSHPVTDEGIKESLRDPVTRKKLEDEADQAIIKEQNEAFKKWR